MENNITLKTGYEWCHNEQIIILDHSKWVSNFGFYLDSFYYEKISYNEFYSRVKKCDVVAGTPRKHVLYLEYRMYGLVAYQLSGTIHAGIQFGHAVVEYGQLVRGIPPFEAIYNKFAEKDKTFIILNGGTTNENPERLGTLQRHSKTLRDNGVMVAEFREPDLNDTLTGVVFLVDERVFKRDLYPDFVKAEWATDEENEKHYKGWLERIGGETNAFLRTFLQNFKLA